MIQRIQSLWLFLAAAVFSALFLFPYLQFADGQGMAAALKVTGVYTSEDGASVRQEFYLWQTLGAVALTIFPLYIIFLFKTRKRQAALAYLNAILVLLFGAWMYFTADTTLMLHEKSWTGQNIGVGFFLLPLVLVFLLLAARAIRKDDKLVRSADRLRG